MPQCKDRLRYRWLGFHLDLTTSARLRSAATPTRRSRSKKRRQRKKNDPKFETFNLLLALGLVPTKSRMNDPQGLLLNRMHVMDGDCPKSEVIGEKAPELDITSNSNNNKSAITTTTAALTTSTTAIITKDVITNNIRSLSPATDHITLHELSKNNNNVIITENNKNIEVVSKENSNEFKEEKKMNGVNEENEHDLSNIENCNNSEVIDSEFGDKINDSNKNGGSGKSNNSNDNNVLVNGNNSSSSNNNMSDSSDHCDSDTKSAEIDEEMLAEDEDDVAKEGLEPDDEEMHIDDEDIDKNIIEDEEEVEDNEQHNEENGEEVTKVAVNKVSNNEKNNNDGNSLKDNEIISLKKGSDEENVQEKNVNISMDVIQETTSTNLPIEATLSALPNTTPPITIRNETPSTSKIKDERNGLSNEDEEEEDRNSVSSSHVNNSNQNRKRTLVQRNEGEGENENEVEGEEGEGSSSESEGGTKRQRVEVEAEDERERLVREYVERCTQSVEEMSRNADKLQREIGALGELARAKELEWNSILRLRKLKEEMLERLLRRRRQAMMLADNGLTQEWATDYSKPKMNKTHNNQLMMVPVVSSSPGNLNSVIPTGINSRPLLSSPDTSSRLSRMQRPILPKPILNHHLSQPIPNSSSSLIDPQNTVIGEGRQGPILDVKSIIADYSGDRSRHPENVPRRGRRMKSPMVSSTRISGSPALMSMANMALCSGAHIRNTSQDCSAQENSRPSSTDSTRSTHQTDLPAPGLSFKDVLVQFAKMSQPPPPTPNPIKQPPPPPPPYPEVTLHPVPAPQSPPPTHSSLLHGILTKTTATPTSTSTANHRPTTFSPTLARLLTAPERERTTPMMSSQFRPPTSRVSISDLLTSSKKTRNEITITPVSAQLSSIKSKDEVVLLDDDEETDSTDRLVIDESADRERENNGGSEVNSEDIPECQGCHQRAALFVCAGCGNQWYCSRECQVTAWEEHSEVCSDQC